MTSARDLSAPIFVLGSHKSGTSLVRNLLDGHPELFVFPSERHFFQWAGFYVHYALRSPIRVCSDLQERAEMLGENATRNQEKLAENRTIDTSELPNDLPLGTSDFRSAFADLYVDSPRDLFVAYFHELYEDRTGDSLEHDVRIVEKSVENAEFAPVLKNWFPNAKFIHIARHPYSTGVAMREHFTRASFPVLPPLLRSLEYSFGALLQNADLLPESYRVIRYEDLVQQSEPLMRDLSEFLDIEWSERLLQPTSFGDEWSGNSVTGKEFDGISDERLGAWRNEITSLEIALLNNIDDAIFERFDYEKVDPPSSPFRPVRNEGLKVYARNRAFLLSNPRSTLGDWVERIADTDFLSN